MGKTLQAITEIHRTVKLGVAGDKAKGIAPVPPQIQVIPANALFEARNQEEFEEFTAGTRPAARVYKTNPDAKLGEEEAAKAVRQISGGSTVRAPERIEDPASVLTGASNEDTVVGNGQNVDDLPDEEALNAITRKADLVAQAESEGLELSEEGNTKADLVAAILAHRSGEELL